MCRDYKTEQKVNEMKISNKIVTVMIQLRNTD